MARFLNKRYNGTKVIVLVDEFDQAVNALFEEEALYTRNKKKGELVETIKKVSKLLGNLIHPLTKGNYTVKKMVLFSVYDALIRNIGSAGNNIARFNSQHPVSGDYFGFTTGQIKNELLEKMIENEDKKEKKIIIERLMEGLGYWYNGYTTIAGKKMTTLFNPYSVMSYF